MFSIFHWILIFFSDKMKIAKVLLVVKIGLTYVMGNTRCISLFPIFSKLLEKKFTLYTILAFRKKFILQQFGFRKKYADYYGLVEVAHYHIKRSNIYWPHQRFNTSDNKIVKKDRKKLWYTSLWIIGIQNLENCHQFVLDPLKGQLNEVFHTPLSWVIFYFWFMLVICIYLFRNKLL